MKIRLIAILFIQGIILTRTENTQASKICDGDEICKPIDECPQENGFAQRKQYHLLKFCGAYIDDTEHCCKKDQFETKPKPTIVSSNILSEAANVINSEFCGRSASRDRIKGGEIASIMQFPWLALLRYRSSDGETESFNCGGSLITNRYVLTAAHCRSTSRITLFSVRLGEHTISNATDCQLYGEMLSCASAPEDFLIDAFIEHKDYNILTKLNDIALIRLASVVELSMEKVNIVTICLPVDDFQQLGYVEQDVEDEPDPDSTVLTIAGWGRTEFDEKGSDVLRFAHVDYQPNPECRRQFAEIKKLPKFRYLNIDVFETQMCAGGKVSADVCKGDSGTAVFGLRSLEKDSAPKFFLHGIVSYGLSCSLDGKFPGVFTRVSSYIDWIKDNMKP